MPPASDAPNPHNPTRTPHKGPSPGQTNCTMGRMPEGIEPLVGTSPPQSNAVGFQVWPGGHQGPVQGHREPTIPWWAQEQHAGSHQPWQQDHAHPWGQGAPRMLEQWGSMSSETGGLGRDGRWLGHGHFQGLTALPDPSLLQTLFIRVLGAAQGDQDIAPALSPRGGQCPLPAARGVQRRAPADSQLPVR